MTRTGVRRRRAAVLVTAAVMAGAWTGPVASALGGGREPTPAERSTYVVRGGDTLWSIAEDIAPGGDPRPIVDAISDANGVDAGALVPGQTLVIPVG